MISQSEKYGLSKKELASFGFARVRDAAFDAVHTLWRKRSKEGIKQVDIANALGRTEPWVSRQLKGPGNWTMRTFGELVEALNGEVVITVHPIEDASVFRSNFDAYVEYESDAKQRGMATPYDASASLTPGHPTLRKSATAWPHQQAVKSSPPQELIAKRVEQVE